MGRLDLGGAGSGRIASATGASPLPRGARLGRPRSTRLPRFTPARAGAVLGILASLGGVYGLAATPAFTYARAEIPELRWTAAAEIEAAIAIPTGTNLFRLTVAPLEARIADLPGVAAATVEVALPDTLIVRVVEREAILGWAVGETHFLVDRAGVLFAEAEPAALAEAGLPLIHDGRATSATLVVGDRIDPVDLDAATRLGSIVPADVGTVAEALVVSVTEANGFVVGTVPSSWIAIFGLYTPSARTPEIVPGQVRLLRSLLAGREPTIATVILSTADEGTYIPRPTEVAPSPAPSAVP
ncbi:MAG TPA: FtsQ-type POTRA domain-containing protein [Candidatus Limnocylindrales bacterium]|nr:FtsQ-type POTRA domain-containing protein [Candidatus Limnocylindrales bacterium]